MKKKLENNQGVTLVALVITIIVLVILATVSIGMILENQGILIQAEKAIKESQNSVSKEKEDIDKLEKELIDNMIDSYKIYYEAEEGIIVPKEQIKKENEQIVLSVEIPIKEGYTFWGWKNKKGIIYQPGDNYKENSSMLLTATWKQNEMYLYNRGNEYKELTNGWNMKTVWNSIGNSTTTYQIRKEAAYFYMYTKHASEIQYHGVGIGFTPENLIDLTDYNIIEINGHFYSNQNAQVYFSVTNQKGDTLINKMIGNSSLSSFNSDIKFREDISSINEPCNILIYLSSSSTWNTMGELKIYNCLIKL